MALVMGMKNNYKCHICDYVCSKTFIFLSIFSIFLCVVMDEKRISDVLLLLLTIAGVMLGIVVTSIAIVIGVITQKDFIVESVSKGIESKIYNNFLFSIKFDFLIMLFSFVFMTFIFIIQGVNFPSIEFSNALLVKNKVTAFFAFLSISSSLSALKDVVFSSISVANLYVETIKNLYMPKKDQEKK